MTALIIIGSVQRFCRRTLFEQGVSPWDILRSPARAATPPAFTLSPSGYAPGKSAAGECGASGGCSAGRLSAYPLLIRCPGKQVSLDFWDFPWPGFGCLNLLGLPAGKSEQVRASGAPTTAIGCLNLLGLPAGLRCAHHGNSWRADSFKGSVPFSLLESREREFVQWWFTPSEREEKA